MPLFFYIRPTDWRRA